MNNVLITTNMSDAFYHKSEYLVLLYVTYNNNRIIIVIMISLPIFSIDNSQNICFHVNIQELQEYFVYVKPVRRIDYT